ncbi:GNAT family N-acetyltransferase [Elioraea rosea]|uniref:GNAT family N-acetyltransferase n=1 Tax=Elioraea rosea TaxID=2492390 RepID=UPI00118717CC|nr:GNAT family N-acetyltransferase [Elioraea rosea]
MRDEASLDIRLSVFPEKASLAARWRKLEEAVPDLSFFQSWTWMGCLFEERFPAPVVIEAARAGETVGLALFNRRGRTLHLGASGAPLLDAPFIEHNAPLVAAAGAERDRILALLFAAAWAETGARHLVLSGVPPALVSRAGGHLLRLQERAAPWVDLAAIRREEGGYRARLSSNTRYQVTRSIRRYERRGPLTLEHAISPTTLEAWLTALMDLHGETWRRRGKPGAFAGPFARRFHAALTAKALARGELDLLRLSAGGDVVGYLYNLRLRGRVSAYQSGLVAAAEGGHEKPGLTLHVLAIERSLAGGDVAYDFLAGDDRYKRSLATESADLAWADLAAPGALGWAQAGAAGLARRLRARLGTRLSSARAAGSEGR